MAFRLMHSAKEAFELSNCRSKTLNWFTVGARSAGFFCKLIVFETLEYRSKFVLRVSEANRIST